MHVCTDAMLPRAELGLPPTLSALLFVSPVRAQVCRIKLRALHARRAMIMHLVLRSRPRSTYLAMFCTPCGTEAYRRHCACSVQYVHA